MPNCHDCSHRKDSPGDAHIGCQVALGQLNRGQVLSLLSLGASGRLQLAEAALWMWVDFRPGLKSWPGCGMWPVTFDPNIVESCPRFEAHVFQERKETMEEQRPEDPAPSKPFLTSADDATEREAPGASQPDQAEGFPASKEYELSERDTEELETIFTYHPPNPGQAKKYVRLRDKGHGLAELISEFVPPSLERIEALRKLQECIMWANAGIARRELPE